MTHEELYEEYLASPWSEASRREREFLEAGEPLVASTEYGAVKGRLWRAGGSSGEGFSRGAVLLAHGWAGRSATWLVLVPLLNAAGFDAVAFDAPGHGETRGAEGSARSNFFAFAATLRAAEGLLAGGGLGEGEMPPGWRHHDGATSQGSSGGESKLDSPSAPAGHLPPGAGGGSSSFPVFRAVVGHSFGGCVIPYALAQGLRAERAVLIAPTARTESFLSRWAAGRGLSAEEEAGVKRSWLAEFGESVLRETDPETLARRMSTPALIVHDTADAEAPVEDGQLLARAWPGATLEATNGLGHRRILLSRSAMERVVAFVAS